MGIIERDVYVEMVRDNLEQIPIHRCPSGYSFRWFEPNDDELWIGIWNASDKNLAIDQGTFENEFGKDRDHLGTRQFFLVDAIGRAIGTSTAWFAEDRNTERRGRVHWIAVIPEMRGAGLSKPIMTTTCERLRELGYDSAMLGTSTARLSAINLYREFGFRPAIRNDEDSKIWQELSPYLRTPLDTSTTYDPDR